VTRWERATRSGQKQARAAGLNRLRRERALLRDKVLCRGLFHGISEDEDKRLAEVVELLERNGVRA
jgi:hypothetical protein